MTSFYMTSLQVDLNEAAKCVDTIPLTLLASLSRLRTLLQDTKWRSYLAQLTGNLRKVIIQFMKVRGLKTWKELTTGVQ